MLKKIFDNLKPRYSYNIFMILSFLNLCGLLLCLIYVLKESGGTEIGFAFYTVFIASPLELIFLAIATIIKVFELLFKKWEIPQNIYNLKILKIIRVLGLITVLFLCFCLYLPILIIAIIDFINHL